MAFGVGMVVALNSSKKAASSSKKPFPKWIEDAAGHKESTAAWTKLSPEALVEIEDVLEWNDTHEDPVSQTTLLKRLKTTHHVSMTRDALKHYVRTVLGRKSWRNP